MAAAIKHPELKSLIGKTITEIAKMRGVSVEDAIIDLVIEDDAGAGAAYTIISEDNIPKQLVLPWVSSGSDAESSAPEGVFVLSSTHPRAYGNFARIFAKYVRDERVLPVAEAVRKITSLPADVLSLPERGRLKKAHSPISSFSIPTLFRIIPLTHSRCSTPPASAMWSSTASSRSKAGCPPAQPRAEYCGAGHGPARLPAAVPRLKTGNGLISRRGPQPHADS
jgi:hypothetical protein